MDLKRVLEYNALREIGYTHTESIRVIKHNLKSEQEVKMKTNKNLDELEETAKELVKKWYGYGSNKRRWLVSIPENSYNSEDYLCRLSVLEGSPPKGYVLRTPHFVLAQSWQASKRKVFRPEQVIC
jgi:hypothetical protein